MTATIPTEQAQTSSAKKRALLDTNIWRYVVDNNSRGALLHIARNGAYNVQIAPGVLYETLRLKDSALRSTLVHLMTNVRFHRLMPEAYSESMEILREIERVRPDWLRKTPDLRFFNRLKKDWSRKTGDFGQVRALARERGAIYRSHGRRRHGPSEITGSSSAQRNDG